MARKNVLVFPCGSEIGLEVHRAMQYSTHFALIGGSSTADHGAFVYEDYVDGIPSVNEPGFVEAIQNLCLQRNIDFIIPAHDDVVVALAKAENNKSITAKVVTSPLETAEVSRSKKRTYELLKELIRCPEIYTDEVQESDFPVFTKPNISQGSKGAKLANNRDELAYFKTQHDDLLVMENLPGDEFTIDCLTDRNGKLRFIEGRIRSRINNGISVNSTVISNPEFKRIAEVINSHMKFRGVWFFQLKEAVDGELVLLEVAPRVAGTMGLTRCRGVNLVLLSMFDLMDYDIEVFENSHKVTIDRALENRYHVELSYEHVYIDFDDLIIFNDKVSPLMVAFLYQCINNGIKLHLITKHANDINESLAYHRLQNVFDNIIHIEKGQDKHKYITETSAIFIDDSFAERKAVHDQLHIPTFDAHMIESLIGKNVV